MGVPNQGGLRGAFWHVSPFFIFQLGIGTRRHPTSQLVRYRTSQCCACIRCTQCHPFVAPHAITLAAPPCHAVPRRARSPPPDPPPSHPSQAGVWKCPGPSSNGEQPDKTLPPSRGTPKAEGAVLFGRQTHPLPQTNVLLASQPHSLNRMEPQWATGRSGRSPWVPGGSTRAEHAHAIPTGIGKPLLHTGRGLAGGKFAPPGVGPLGALGNMLGGAGAPRREKTRGGRGGGGRDAGGGVRPGPGEWW